MGFEKITYAIIIAVTEWAKIKKFEIQNIEISNSNIVTPETKLIWNQNYFWCSNVIKLPANIDRLRIPSILSESIMLTE
jgi:hypothetical protein